jgi:epoxyqueuosine reductase
MGNALRAPRESLSADARKAIVEALERRADDSSHVVREHVQWALEAA